MNTLTPVLARNGDGSHTLIDPESGEVFATIRRLSRQRYAYSLPHWTDTEIVVYGPLSFARDYVLDVARPRASWLTTTTTTTGA